MGDWDATDVTDGAFDCDGAGVDDGEVDEVMDGAGGLLGVAEADGAVQDEPSPLHTPQLSKVARILGCTKGLLSRCAQSPGSRHWNPLCKDDPVEQPSPEHVCGQQSPPSQPQAAVLYDP